MSENIFKQWWAEYYDKEYNKTHDLGLITELVNSSKKENQRIFETCCGSGRILLPLAKQGHEMYSVEMNNQMISRLFSKANNHENIQIIQGNVITADWGNGYDVVLVSFNILTNIEHSDCDESNQYRLIKKAYAALEPGGYMYIDCCCYRYPEKYFKTTNKPEISYFDADTNGITVKKTNLWDKYDISKRILSFKRTFELTTKTGEIFVHEEESFKYFPTVDDLTKWVKQAGFEIIYLWDGFYKKPITDETDSAIFWAKKSE